MTPVAVLDASVLYPSTVRSVLMLLAAFDAFRALCSADLHREWMVALARDRPDLAAKRIARTRALMEAHLPNAMVNGYQRHIDKLVLPDPDDRHVLAAALHGKANIIVTSNLKHFPKAVLKAHGMTAQHPDDFVCDLIAADLDRAVRAFVADRARMANPPKSAAAYLAGIRARGLTNAVILLRNVIDQL